MPDAVMLFAAGFGTRMRPLTNTRPKPLIEVGGQTLLDRALDLAREVPRKVVNAHYLGEQIVAHLEGTGVQVSMEAPDILDTGGGLRQALGLLGDAPVFTLNTDMVWIGDNPLDRLAAQWDPARMDALLLCVPVARTIGRKGAGDFTLEGGQLIRGGDLVYTGAQILKTDLLEDIPEPSFSLNRLWDLMSAEGRLCGTVYDGIWCDIGHPEGIALAEEALSRV